MAPMLCQLSKVLMAKLEMYEEWTVPSLASVKYTSSKTST